MQLEQGGRGAEMKTLIDGTSRQKGRPDRANGNYEQFQPSLYYPAESSTTVRDKLNECLQSSYVGRASHDQNGLSYYPQAQLAPRQDLGQYTRY